MSCSICLESYLDYSKVPDAERLPFLRLEKENLPPPGSPTSKGCCFFRSKDLNKDGNEDLDPEQRKLTELQPVTTKCGHIFHYGCILNWSDTPAKGKRGCPICRETIVLKNLIKIHLDVHVIIRQDTAAGILVSMSLNRYNTLKDGFSLGYHNGKETYEEEFDARMKIETGRKEQAQKEIVKLKTENATEMEKLRTKNAAEMEKLKTENAAEMDKLKSENAAEMEKLKSETAAEMEKLKTENAAEIVKLKTEHGTAIEQLKTEHATELKKVKTENGIAMQKLRTENATEKNNPQEMEQNSVDIQKFRAGADLQAPQKSKPAPPRNQRKSWVFW